MLKEAPGSMYIMGWNANKCQAWKNYLCSANFLLAKQIVWQIKVLLLHSLNMLVSHKEKRLMGAWDPWHVGTNAS